MGLFDFLMGPSSYEKDRAEKQKNKTTIFDKYSSAEDYAEVHRDDHDGWEDAMDAWYANKRKQKR